ncbi:MAG: TetR/AcrR family transcriptional regulator [Rhodospirillales bacterium]|nr:TetR/AcrR family transcriptional regulator [Rhodospirillales bacterium]
MVSAAMRVIARMGPDAPTIDDFVAEAGVARGSFYNYFRTTEELLIAVATDVSDQFLTDDIRLVRDLPDPADRVGCSVRAYIRLAASDSTRGWVIVRIALIAAPIGTSMPTLLAEDIAAGMRERRFTVQSAQAATDIVLGAGLMGMRSVLRGDAAPDHAETVAEMVLLALGVPDAAAVARRSLEPDAIAQRAAAKLGRRGATEVRGEDPC